MESDAKRRARATLSEQHGWTCHYCGMPLVPDGEWDTYCNKFGDSYLEPSGMSFPELDHLMPRSKGGSSKIDNLVLSCGKCNHQKNDKTEGEYIGWLNR